MNLYIIYSLLQFHKISSLAEDHPRVYTYSIQSDFKATKKIHSQTHNK